MKTLTYEETRQYEKDYTLVPIAREIYADVVTPITLLRKIAALDKQYYLLESVEGGEKWGRYSFLGFQPLLQLLCKNGEVTIKSGAIRTKVPGEPMEALRKLLKEYRAPRIAGLPPFAGGFVGYFAYEMIGYAEPKLKLKQNDCNDYDLMLFDKVIAYDHLTQKICVIVNARLEDGEQGYHAALLEIEKIIHMVNDMAPLPKAPAAEAPEFICNTSKERYIEMVERTK